MQSLRLKMKIKYQHYIGYRPKFEILPSYLQNLLKSQKFNLLSVLSLITILQQRKEPTCKRDIIRVVNIRNKSISK